MKNEKLGDQRLARNIRFPGLPPFSFFILPFALSLNLLRKFTHNPRVEFVLGDLDPGMERLGGVAG